MPHYRSIDVVEYWLGELVYASRQYIFSDHFLDSYDLFVLHCTDVLRRNMMLITNGAAKVQQLEEENFHNVQIERIPFPSVKLKIQLFTA